MTLSSETIAATLQTNRFGRSGLELHARIDSTNRRAHALAVDGAAEGTVVLAESQTAGRGRRGRSWHSPAGVNLYLSIVLRPHVTADRIGLLPLVAGVAVADAVEETAGFAPDLKWPNDLQHGGKKIVGILAEAELSGSVPSFVVLGIGINVNQPATPDVAASVGTLAEAAGHPLDRLVVLARLLKRLEERYDQYAGGACRNILARYRERCITVGRMIRLNHKTVPRNGMARSVDEQGRLVVEWSDGRGLEALDAGEISHVRPVGPDVTDALKS